jgi:hypothetical protein
LEYTDIQTKCTFRERGKGEGKRLLGENVDKTEGGHRIRIWNVGGRLAKYLKPGVRKEMLCICRTPDVLCYRLQTLFLVDSTKMYHLELNELSVDRIA